MIIVLVMDNFYGKMEISMLEHGMIIKSMAMGHIQEQMVMFIEENGNLIE